LYFSQFDTTYYECPPIKKAKFKFHTNDVFHFATNNYALFYIFIFEKSVILNCL